MHYCINGMPEIVGLHIPL